MKTDLAELKVLDLIQNDPSKISGGEMVVAALIEERVEFVWGYPGEAALPIYDALAKQDALVHVLVRHEQGALHAADGYARATGKTGVALVTSGPGVTNAITGIATAYFDSIPLVVITANVPSDLRGQDAFQESDAVGLTRSISKHNFLVNDLEDLPITLKKAFFLASTGRPGPVLIDIAKDVLQSRAAFSYPAELNIRSYRPPGRPDEVQLDEAVSLFLNAQRPYIYIGGGAIAANVSPGIAQLVELTNAPVTTTLMALGAFPGSHKNSLGMPGMHGTFEANMAMEHCDVLLALGARFDDRVIGDTKSFKARDRKIIHVDIDPASISKRVRAHLSIVGDLRFVTAVLVEKIGLHRGFRKNLEPWWAMIDDWRSENCLAYETAVDEIRPQYVIERLRELVDDDTVICSDVGQHQMWTAQYYKFNRPRRWINSGGLGTMGVGLPFAIGAKLGCPSTNVVVVTGDGSIQMCIQELSTCLQYGVAIKIVCLNNRSLGMVRQQQHVDHSSRFSHSYMESLPDFALLANAYGHVGIDVRKRDELDSALRRMLDTNDRTVFLNIEVTPESRVWPMIRAGSRLTEMLRSERDI